MEGNAQDQERTKTLHGKPVTDVLAESKDPDGETTPPSEPEEEPTPGGRSTEYVVLQFGGTDTEALGSWHERGRATGANRPAAWEDAEKKYPELRSDGAIVQLIPTRYWKAVRVKLVQREPEIVAEGL